MLNVKILFCCAAIATWENSKCKQNEGRSAAVHIICWQNKQTNDMKFCTKWNSCLLRRPESTKTASGPETSTKENENWVCNVAIYSAKTTITKQSKGLFIPFKCWCLHSQLGICGQFAVKWINDDRLSIDLLALEISWINGQKYCQ